MAKKKPNEAPLWLRAIRDPAAKAWLKKNRKEFPVESFLPDPISFKDKIVLAREKIAELIRDGMSYEDEKMQELAVMVLEMTPRLIARQLKIPRREVYIRIRALKRIAIRKWQERREALVLARGPKARVTQVSPPEGIALCTLQFALGDRKRYAYLVQIGKVREWLDEEGKRYTSEIQEILQNIEVYQKDGEGFQAIEVHASIPGAPGGSIV